MIKLIFAFLSFVLVVGGANAETGINNANAMLQYWSNPTMNWCNNTSDTVNGTIGRLKNVCTGNRNSQCVLVDDYGALMLVAREINENGANFCVTTIYAEHKKKGNAWTLYSNPAGGAKKCFWMCKSGHYGDKCSQTTPNGCDSTPLTRNSFDSYNLSRDYDVEGSIAMFHWQQYKGCGAHKGQEHDMILAISDWLPSGHGAYASPFIVRATRDGWKDRIGWPTIWATGSPTLLCKNGYQANAAGNDCEPVDANACAITQLCSGWASNGFSESSMVTKYDDARGCFTYRCSESGKAFASSTDKSCVDCATNNRNGISPADGTCVRCNVGQIFDETASSSGYCVQTTAYVKTDMVYGRGLTHNNAPSDISQQCWTKADPTEYRECVTGK